MSINVSGKSLSRISVIDDLKDMREALSDEIEDLDLEPMLLAGPLSNCYDTFKQIKSISDAALCDLNLKVRNYANFSGAQLVAYCSENSFPGVLITSNIANRDTIDNEIRPYLDGIPVMLLHSEVGEDIDVLAHAIEKSAKEAFNIKREESRVAWRTLIRFERFDENSRMFEVEIPAWDNPQDAPLVRLKFEKVPEMIRDRFLKEGKSRFFAQSNIGAEKYSQIFVKSFEY
ncbi:hypothetical protein [Hymenobacter siberiensis]|uniref:hypothetical protein n=1 Tax=Hymenobacter siberiensis TaxID=2848396 RepID=UPI001C1E10D5|nr:hypothetical protein [Hymenobacter siberiensis]